MRLLRFRVRMMMVVVVVIAVILGGSLEGVRLAAREYRFKQSAQSFARLGARHSGESQITVYYLTRRASLGGRPPVEQYGEGRR